MVDRHATSRQSMHPCPIAQMCGDFCRIRGPPDWDQLSTDMSLHAVHNKISITTTMCVSQTHFYETMDSEGYRVFPEGQSWCPALYPEVGGRYSTMLH